MRWCLTLKTEQRRPVSSWGFQTHHLFTTLTSNFSQMNTESVTSCNNADCLGTKPLTLRCRKVWSAWHLRVQRLMAWRIDVLTKLLAAEWLCLCEVCAMLLHSDAMPPSKPFQLQGNILLSSSAWTTNFACDVKAS